MNFCKYCGEHFHDWEYSVESMSKRKLSYINDVYTGIETYIDLDSNELVVFACLDNKNIKPVCDVVRIPISYCPICGRKLEEE